tara:strand:+ start:284 stop:523 length:240 start_codon:yes stop_codon:yes gene_type:complete
MENKETNPNEPAFAKPAFYHPNGGLDSPNEGLTKREYFASMALQGIIANKDGLDIKIERIVESAVDTADALIEELNKTK